MKKLSCFAIISMFLLSAKAQTGGAENFEQLGTLLPTPNVFRTASGAPGPEYWQQRADYQIEMSLDENEQVLYGLETVTYFNNSPDPLSYLWVQLDQNIRAKDSDTYKIDSDKVGDSLSFDSFSDLAPWFDGGFKIEYVHDVRGDSLTYTINKTMMRIDLPKTLVSKGAITFKIKWHYNLNDRAKTPGRSGYEYFPDENNSLYIIAQFYPRMAVYADNVGWQNKQFLGRGEFALTFGNFDVKLTVPSDHIVAATGELQNAGEVLSAQQIQRFANAKTAKKPLEIITQAEAEAAEKNRSSSMKTWHFKAQNVRDFGWASSRKFIWDARGIEIGDRTVMAMSYYPKEGNPLWGKYSTEAVLQTLETYSRHTFDYPYPVAISVNADNIGMEYPMICFNYGRTEPDGTYSARTKYGMIGVIIHEVGHNFFPMIVNSDERQWTWMDEGLNTFLQNITEQEFDRNFPSRRLEPRQIVDYMKGNKEFISPIMTNSESIHQLGNNAYGKTAIGLSILRETIMGRELFDFAFKTYAQRWMFKNPAPADFFRTMEDASAVDLDWFWRGWFYTTNVVDLSLDKVEWLQPNYNAPEEQSFTSLKAESPKISALRNRESILKTRSEADTTLQDFYTSYSAKAASKTEGAKWVALTSEEEKELTDRKYYYQLSFSNLGGFPMPLIVQFNFRDGDHIIKTIPAEIWRKGAKSVSKIFVLDQEVENVVLDPYLQTADIDLKNNSWPARPIPTRFEIFKAKDVTRKNEMQQARDGN